MELDSIQNMPASELAMHVTRAIKAGGVNPTPLVVETEDEVTHGTRPTHTEPHGAQGLKPPDPRSRDQGSKAGPRRAQGRLASDKSQRRKCR